MTTYTINENRKLNDLQQSIVDLVIKKIEKSNAIESELRKVSHPTFLYKGVRYCAKTKTPTEVLAREEVDYFFENRWPVVEKDVELELRRTINQGISWFDLLEILD